MSRNGSGTYSLPAGNPVTTGTTISSTTHNNTLSDIATALSDSLAKDGQTTPTANLPMGGYAHTGVGDATARTQYAKVSQVQDGGYVTLSSVSGTNTITATCAPAITAYAAGQFFTFVSAGANTGAVTLNINSLGAKAVTKEGTTALAAGEIASGAVVCVEYDGTRFQIVGGRSVQPLDATLTALASALTAANKIPYATALNTLGELDFKDEDNMASNSATALPSQQSVKAYVDATMALGTAASASGVAVDFVGIASTAKRVTILISALSANGTSLPIVQLGDSGGFETTGYAGSSGLVQNGGASATAAMSSGFIFVPSIADVTVVQGRVVLEKINGNTWVATSVMASSNTAVPMFSAGVKTLTGTLTQVRITTTNGTDAFDAGTINIVVE